jgi:phosphomannomutase
MNKFIKTYIGFLKKFLRPQKSLRVVFDSSNGTTGPILKRLMTNNPQLTTYLINDKPNGNFPGHGPNPMLKGATKQLQVAVKQNKADLGIIFDADGDRVFVCDDQGRLVHPDIIAYLLVYYLKPKKMVINTPTGWLVRSLKRQGVKIYETPVGYFYVTRAMRKTGATFAAEHSAHYFFKNFFYRDAGILTAISVINAASKLPYCLSDFVDLVPQSYRSWEINFIVKNKERLLKIIEGKYKKEAKKISRLDGLKMDFDKWWLSIRPSQNEPLLRLNIEAETEEVLRRKLRAIRETISA